MIKLATYIDFDQALNYVINNEGGLIENPCDPGGITKYGISLRFLKSLPADKIKNFGIATDNIDENNIKNLTIEQAKSIYKSEFWDNAPFEKINSQPVVNYLFDCAVNIGINPAIKCIQRACWAVLKQRSIPDDGILGQKTIETINSCIFYILPALRSERAGYYRITAERNNLDEIFLNGWLSRSYR